ncbi:MULTISPECIES: hypothetical protein [Bradyrhizobium]|uniref:hypothetical protein n=1 Tax=Bradyrhizobium TaxID=374 RepID=UPI001FEE70A2|nr:hypothetical protein [Bradyrhizobium diazoefficiens]WLA53404.1 hypothetical protein QIH81_22795 [Bradyrhizobium diazoefficiens]
MVLATRVGVARASAMTQRDEGERAAAGTEIDAGDPLRRREVIERRKAAFHEPRQHQHDGARAHADREKAERA